VTDTGALLCLASYQKGEAFLDEAHRLGRHVILLTTAALESGEWPRESIDELFSMPDLSDVDAVTNGVSYLARTRQIDRIVPLDEYDVPTAAALREHLRLEGMGISRARLFRDKLAMRMRAHEHHLPVPDFSPLFNDDAVHDFSVRVPAPWVLKPRSEVSSIGIARVESADELWGRLNDLGDRRSHFLLERYVPGNVYHVDSIVYAGEVVFAEAHQYLRPPMDVFHTGGIAMSRTVSRGSGDEVLLRDLNGEVLRALGMRQGVTHMEFIRGRDDGQFYFLEVGGRVGGAHTAEMVEAATGINLWREWARLEVLGEEYALPERRREYGAVIVSLANQEYPNTSAYADPEITYRVQKHHHVGFVLASSSEDRVRALQEEYSRRIGQDFAASMPPWQERPPEG
jgi:carbamoylphosphate synthase large subunit